MRTLWITAAVVFCASTRSRMVIVVHWLDLMDMGSIDVLPPFLNFRMAWNRGINFGLFSRHCDWARWVLIAIALVISGWVVWWLQREDEGCWALSLGGAAGRRRAGQRDGPHPLRRGGGFPEHVLLRDREPVVVQRGRHRDLRGRLRA